MLHSCNCYGRFGHVSPTTAEHVLADLGAHDITVLRPKRGGEEEEEGAHCEVGIESTVAKVDVDRRLVSQNERGKEAYGWRQ